MRCVRWTVELLQGQLVRCSVLGEGSSNGCGAVGDHVVRCTKAIVLLGIRPAVHGRSPVSCVVWAFQRWMVDAVCMM